MTQHDKVGVVERGCVDEPGKIVSRVRKPMSTTPGSGVAVARQVHRHDPSPTGGKRWRDSPEDAGRGGHAMDEEERRGHRGGPRGGSPRGTAGGGDPTVARALRAERRRGRRGEGGGPRDDTG